MLAAFRAVVTDALGELPGSALLPSRLARAAADVLPVDGAGLSLFFSSGRRLPLGASDDASATAERLQFTVGEGPCLAANQAGQPVIAGAEELALRWPTFWAELAARTPFRGIIALPLAGTWRDVGALDLYVAPPHDVHDLSYADAVTVGDEVARSLRDLDGPEPGEDAGPAWLDAPAAAARARVWQAVGFLNVRLHVSTVDALAVLRAHAYSAGTTVDVLAQQVLTGVVPVQDLAPEA